MKKTPRLDIRRFAKEKAIKINISDLIKENDLHLSFIEKQKFDGLKGASSAFWTAYNNTGRKISFEKLSKGFKKDTCLDFINSFCRKYDCSPEDIIFED